MEEVLIMNCPTVDKLSQYVDVLVHEYEMKEIKEHVEKCDACMSVVKAFQAEQQFIKETVQTPALPDEFAASVLAEIKPYKQKTIRRRSVWKRVGLSAAGVLLAVGVGASVSPSFAQLIGGFFASDEVDNGLQLAADQGLTKTVNVEVENNGLTFKVEDVITDTSRIALSFLIVNDKGEAEDTNLNLADSNNEITVVDQNGAPIETIGTSWQEGSDYGLIEVSLRDYEAVEQVTIHFDLVELNGVKGNWVLDVPVDVKQNEHLTKIVPIDQEANHLGVTINFQKINIAPTSMDLLYETSFTADEQKEIEARNMNNLEKVGGKAMDSLVGGFQSNIAYRLKVNEQETYSHGIMYGNKFESLVGEHMQSAGHDLGTMGHVSWIDSFVPQELEGDMMLSVEGVYKTEPADFSIDIETKEVKRQPISFEYEGNFMTIKSIKKPLNLLDDDKSIIIKMEGGKEAFSSDLGDWIAVDEKGNRYATSESGSVLNEKDKNERYKTNVDLTIEGLHEVPEKLTLYLISKTTYYPLDEKWEVPISVK